MNIPAVSRENRQAVYDFVCTKLAEQGGPAKDEKACFYRHPSGRRCGIGWLIPDELYEEETMGGQFASELRLFDHSETDFLRALQRAHDRDGKGNLTADVLPPETIRENFRRVAASFNLAPAAADLIVRWEAA